jgi:hypothetical protein
MILSLGATKVLPSSLVLVSQPAANLIPKILPRDPQGVKGLIMVCFIDRYISPDGVADIFLLVLAYIGWTYGLQVVMQYC